MPAAPDRRPAPECVQLQRHTPMVPMRMGYVATAALLAGTVGLAACANGSRGGVSLAKRRPNIVFVLLDDVRYDDVIDHPFVDLPNLKRIAREGASFQRSFTSAPLCSPSRAIFMTGQYAQRSTRRSTQTTSAPFRRRQATSICTRVRRHTTGPVGARRSPGSPHLLVRTTTAIREVQTEDCRTA